MKQQDKLVKVRGEFMESLVLIIENRIRKLREYLDLDEIDFRLYCQVDYELCQLRQFIRENNIPVSVDIGMELLRN